MINFTKKNIDHSPIRDSVFSVAAKAAEAIKIYGKDNVVNATIGSLYNEEGELVALKTVFDTYNNIPAVEKAKYAQSFNGNDNFRKAVYNWVCGDKVKLRHDVIATPGGSGAVSLAIADILDEGETLVLPDIAWGSYKLMASMNNENCRFYSMFNGDKFNLESFVSTCRQVMEKQGKVLAIINDPCHNPTGYSMTNEEWEKLIAAINRLSKKGPFVLLDDIAYIDYSYNLNTCRNYMTNFNDIGENVMIIVAFSSSKTLTSYGLRCGAAVVLAKGEEAVNEFITLSEKSARALWSNIPNAAMENFVLVTGEKHEEFMAEKQEYVELLKKRSRAFVSEALDCGLDCYPYKEGFFVTVKVENKDILAKYHQELMKNNIFAVAVNKGIRVAICSLPVKQCKGLAPKMKEILDSVSAQ